MSRSILLLAAARLRLRSALSAGEHEPAGQAPPSIVDGLSERRTDGTQARSDVAGAPTPSAATSSVRTVSEWSAAVRGPHSATSSLADSCHRKSCHDVGRRREGGNRSEGSIRTDAIREGMKRVSAAVCGQLGDGGPQADLTKDARAEPHVSSVAVRIEPADRWPPSCRRPRSIARQRL